MRRAIAILVAMLGVVACGSSSLTAAHSPSPVARTSPTTSPSPIAPVLYDPATFPKMTGAYGLLYSRTPNGGQYLLHLVQPDGTLAASVPLGSGVESIGCGNTTSVNIPPPVSASDAHVYLRNGSAIKLVVPPSNAVDVTSVPDGPTTISMFSVRPDDLRIAVVVVDVSSPTTISLRLYVEDLVGHGHHADIFTASASRSGTPTILWPMGWHNGNLVLAVAKACVSGLRESPTEWHVSSATTAQRVATVKGTNCQMSTWPSAAGVACAQAAGPTTLYDWSGKVVSVTGPYSQFPISDTSISPQGQSIFFSGTSGTQLVQLGPGPYATLPDQVACAWIDEDHLLSTKAVIGFAAETPGNVQINTTEAALDQSAQPDPSTPQTSGCAGRFPGSL